MKNFLRALAVLSLVGFSTSILAAESSGDTTVKFSVEKMTCATCPIAVRKAMERVEGVKEVTVDFDSKTAIVTFDASMATASDIGTASTDVGFPASVLDDQ